MMGSSSLSLRYNISDWSNCRERPGTVTGGVVVAGEYRTREVTICDRSDECVVIHTNHDNRGDLFNLEQECISPDPKYSVVEIIAVMFFTIMILFMMFGCAWQCGCFTKPPLRE
jgi:hypothetical protein